MKKIGILTSGGDAPGMNAVIRAVVRRANASGIEVAGIHRGYEGLLERDIHSLSSDDVAGIIQRGGTVLKTARSKKFSTPEGLHLAAANLREAGIEGLIVAGGDGSMRGADLLSRAEGISTIVVPGTIDNDMNGTDYTIGFDTALNNILDAVNKIRDTADSHQRVAVVEVMGRCSGQLALMSGLSCGAEIILIPEIHVAMSDVCEKIKESHQKGKLYSIVIVAEGAAKGAVVGETIAEVTGAEVSVSVLGYLQRGGSPSAMDNIIGTRLGVQAVEELIKGHMNCLVGMNGSEVVAIPYEEAYQKKRGIHVDLYNLALGVSR